MTAHDLDGLIALFDRLVEDEARAFTTRILLDPRVEDPLEMIDSCRARHDAVVARTRADLRVRLQAMSIQYPATVTLHGFDRTS